MQCAHNYLNSDDKGSELDGPLKQEITNSDLYNWLLQFTLIKEYVILFLMICSFDVRIGVVKNLRMF